ncbi:cobyrinate a,c-diamide synthase [Thiospirillum jenense]|uniref:cobyrinate a,c-diamide synthase n=1 Tax=Thiospirillum jenense TaxID=1653858 RepID=UPI0030B7FE59
MATICPAVFIAAPASGQGKTTLTAGLARLYRQHGLQVQVFKTGPDFLDPLILERASGATVYNLDLWMGGAAHCQALLYQAALTADVIVVEGAMGLYDGHPSGAELAAQFALPVMCVIDAHAMAQTFAAIAWGLVNFQPGLTVAGVLANRVGSANHVALLTDALPESVRLLAAIRRDAALELPHRHLGLWQAEEITDLDARLDRIAAVLANTALVDLPPTVTFHPPPPALQTEVTSALRGVRIAIAHDRAFAFIYPANLDVLRAAGAELVNFSPLTDQTLPPCDAVYLPGGYPELYLRELAANQALIAALRAHHAANKPLLAECGGLLYTLTSLAAVHNEPIELLNLLPGHAQMQPRLVNLGLHEVTLPEGTLRGHTFHHSRSTVALAPLAQSTPQRPGASPESVWRIQRLTASYLHLYFPSNPDAAVRLFLP